MYNFLKIKKAPSEADSAQFSRMKIAHPQMVKAFLSVSLSRIKDLLMPILYHIFRRLSTRFGKLFG